MEKTPKLREAELVLTANARLFPTDPIAVESLQQIRSERSPSRRAPAR